MLYLKANYKTLDLFRKFCVRFKTDGKQVNNESICNKYEKLLEEQRHAQ